MATTLATLETKLGYHMGLTLSSTTRWTTTQADALLNDAMKEVVRELHAAKCWKLLRELQKEATYTLTGATTYNVYTILGSSTDYYAFLNAKLDSYKVREVTIEDEDRIQANGEYYPTGSYPWICFYGYDSTENHGNLPVVRIRPSGSTGTLYFRYLRVPPTMGASASSCLPAECDNALIFLAASWLWSGDRNGEDSSRFYQLYQNEINRLIAKYEEPVYYDVNFQPTL